MSWHKGIPQRNSEIEGEKRGTLTAVIPSIDLFRKGFLIKLCNTVLQKQKNWKFHSILLAAEGL
jgi:hypothetical protein